MHGKRQGKTMEGREGGKLWREGGEVAREKSVTRLRPPMNIDATPPIRVNLHGERVNLKLKSAGEIA